MQNLALTNDIIFKMVFGTEKRESILRGLINAVFLMQDEEVAMAIKAYRQVSASEEVRELLEFRMKAERDEATRLSRARKEGRQEGRQEGREQGKLEAARRMLAAGVDLETVCQALEIPANQLSATDEKD